MKKSILFITSLVLLCACSQKNTKASMDSRLVGNDKDRHGCIGSAGYTWSEVRGECIRLFEIGILTTSLTNETENAYIVLSQDSTEIELFCSNELKNEILVKNAKNTWGNADNTLNVVLKDNIWSISIKGKDEYKQTK